MKIAPQKKPLKDDEEIDITLIDEDIDPWEDDKQDSDDPDDLTHIIEDTNQELDIDYTDTLTMYHTLEDIEEEEEESKQKAKSDITEDDIEEVMRTYNFSLDE